MEADHPPRAFGNGDEVEGVGVFDGAKLNPMHRGDLLRIGRQTRAVFRHTTTGVIR